MTRYQVPREEISINLTNISEQVYCLQSKWGYEDGPTASECMEEQTLGVFIITLLA